MADSAETEQRPAARPRRRHRPLQHGRIAILRDIGYVSFGKYGQYVITVVTLPLISRLLGPHGVGLLAIGMSSYFIGSLAVDLGITSFLAAKVHDATDGATIERLRGTYLAVRATTLSVLGAALLVSLPIGVPAALHMILLGLFAGGLWSISEDWLLIGQGRFGTSTLYQGAGRIGYLVLLVLWLPRMPTATTAMLCLLLSSLLTIALTWWDALRTYGIPGRPRQLRQVLRIGAPVLTSRALVTSYGQGSAAVYAAVLDTASLGLYSAGDRLVRAFQSLLDPIGFALLPRMARRGAEETFWRNATRSLLACLAAAGVATLGVWLAAPILVHVMFGNAFAAAVPLLRVEVLILPATTITSLVTTAVLPVRQDTTGVLIGAVIGTCVAAGALAIAVHTESVWTLVYGTVAAEITVALWYVVRMRWLVVTERAARRDTTESVGVAGHEEGDRS
ncbi:lipopolysaccharide biosynthesis protein [Nocardia mexicana]|uniref:O-antigen/teichoic acid export membrane protein n=1 Tax=Nocardia mexicana TaxID=279262 RepID=A0A370HF21_9NOCA|nr:lipopolysaccharide biosynthesis protein [Nocardia mexicana]RDI55813.1 O-antigen/teichoic acid export membrane protein [Nocardia mexicana]